MLDRSRLLMGVYGIDGRPAHDDAMRDIADLGADFIISVIRPRR